MSNIALVSPATGTATFSITTPSGTSTDRTLNLPDNSGTVLTSASSIAASQLGSQFSVSSSAPSSSLVMDASGRVTMPNQPAFSVRKTNGTVTTASGVIVFNAVDTNTGSRYNNSNGRFTAPIAGRYLFVFSGAGTIEASFVLDVNGAATGYHAYSSSSDEASTLNAILTLNANDYVEIRSLNTYRGDNHTMWCGYLIG